MSRLALVCALAALAGCSDYEASWEPDEWEPPPPPQQHSPLISAIGIPTFPPIGPSGAVQVQVSDADGDLASARVSFQKELMRSVSGSAATITVAGPALGEGYGTLTVFLSDHAGRSSTRSAMNVLVDLTPPKIVLGQTVVASTDELELWVGDAWVLGKVSLVVGDQVQTHTFEPGWPETLGKTWDYSLVKFQMQGLPAIKGPAKLVATDAAGNTETESFTLSIDDTPPLLGVVSPSEGATLSGGATIAVESSDPGGGPVWVQVSLGGTPVGTLSGGKQTLGVNTATLLPGPHQLVVTATDQAGNESVAKRSVLVQ